jgi:methylmalonyl-CoA/ethylmalonyl-CoA epimerase
MIGGAAFHHLGVACRSIEAEFRYFEALGYRPEGEPFEDPIQKIRGRFVIGLGPRLELLEPLTDDSPVVPWIERGVKIYHQAFEVEELPGAIAALVSRRARIVVAPVPAVAFEGRKIAFLVLPNMALVELIAARRCASASDPSQ